MANNTSKLNLTLPGFGEFTDSWDVHMNENFSKIDAWAFDISKEIQEARFTKSSLKSFLEKAHNTDGTLQPTAEVVAARDSFFYGPDQETDLNMELGVLAKVRDVDLWKACANSSDLRDALAYRSSFRNLLLAGMKDSNGYPTWCGFTGNTVHIDGSVSPLMMMIDGKISRVRTLENEIISDGTAGTKYIYATFQSDGISFLSNALNTTSSVGADKRTHAESGKNYVAAGVKVGDILRYKDGANKGDYIISEVAPGGLANQLKIKSYFKESIGGTYDIIDPLGVTIRYGIDETPAAGRIYIAEADFSGSAVTAVRPRNFGSEFVGEWRQVNVTSVSTFLQEWNHNFGTDKVSIEVQASKADDGSEPVEQLFNVRLANSLSLSAPVLSGSPALTGTATGGNGTLAATTGTLAVAAPTITGGAVLENAVLVRHTRNKVSVKNAVPSSFFRDFDGVNCQSGYIRVIITKKG